MTILSYPLNPPVGMEGGGGAYGGVRTVPPTD